MIPAVFVTIWAFHLLNVQGISILCASAVLKTYYHCTTRLDLAERRGGCTLQNPSQAACSTTALQLGEQLVCGLVVCFCFLFFVRFFPPSRCWKLFIKVSLFFSLDIVSIACVLRFQLDETAQVCSLAFIQASGCFWVLVLLCNSSSAHP